MKKFGLGCAIVGGLALLGLIVVLIAAGGYNRLVRLSQNVDKQWAQVENVYQRRADLIPNLVATVSGAANFEKSTLTEVVEARASVGQVRVDPNNAPRTAAQLGEFERAQGQLSSALSRLLVVVERYPDLKASGNFQTLQAQLEGSENRIAVERGRFNEAVKDYNTAIRSFPALLYAGVLGFESKPYFASKAGAENAPSVQFDFSKPAGPPAAEKPEK